MTGHVPGDYGVDKPILIGEFPAAAYESDGLPGGDSTRDVMEQLYTREFAGAFSWAFIPDEFNGHGGLEQDVLVTRGQINIGVLNTFTLIGWIDTTKGKK